MKEKPSEWIAISDLMAGVMAVVMLLLVVAVLQKSTSELHHQQELEKLKGGKDNPVVKVMAALQEMLKAQKGSDLMTLDLNSKRLTLNDGVFERGSACLTTGTRAELLAVQNQLVNFLKDPRARIQIEGYSDNVPVKRPVVDFQRFCTVYDDNFTLSAARAREARRALVGTLDDTISRRIVVAGYGESRPLSGLDPADSKNRRVEVQFLYE